MFRGRVVPGRSDTVDEWMTMLNDRLTESVATLNRERMGIEIVFRQRDGEDEYLYWVIVRGDGESVETSQHQLDIDHRAYDALCRQPGWQTATSELLLLPDRVRGAVLEACCIAEV